ncbi:hypothetical protein PoB_002114100 [Plakobranchus ocellatus]|uniref:Uncharacterized protein n=1 Tax=Plakobranchus ocellatus TaxID=259542 RepID=A0AAV3ZFG8_9GAST|nr:hypothetical protein PoB_002114100 [Plakobranchus ocellatus]
MGEEMNKPAGVLIRSGTVLTSCGSLGRVERSYTTPLETSPHPFVPIIAPWTCVVWFGLDFIRIASLQHGDLRLSGPQLGESTVGWARTCNRAVPVDLRAALLSTVPPKPPMYEEKELRCTRQA